MRITSRRIVSVGSGLAALLAVTALAAPRPEDRTALGDAFDTLAGGNDPEASIVANRIFGRDEYAAADYEELLAGYLGRRFLTVELGEFLERVALAGPETTRKRALQEALATVLVEQTEEVLTSHLPNDLGPALERRPDRYEHLRTSMRLLGAVAFGGEQLSAELREGLYDRLAKLIQAYPDVLLKRVTIDLERQPRVPAVRAQLYKIMHDLLRPFDADRFVADAGFSGRYAELARDHGLLVLDDNGLDERQLRAIQQLLALIPADLHRTAHISQHDRLGNRREETVEWSFTGSPGVNIVGDRIEERSENQFPEDGTPVSVPIFCSALQHELNHMVDAYAIRRDPRLSSRRDELIEQVGSSDSREYLRSMFPADYFEEHPQELFASISNEYLSGSAETLLLALERFDRGWKEPLNQFLFFADVYSEGGDETLFFEQDPDCNYVAYEVPLGRDELGRIDRLEWQGLLLRFRLDEAGNVLR